MVFCVSVWAHRLFAVRLVALLATSSLISVGECSNPRFKSAVSLLQTRSFLGSRSGDQDKFRPPSKAAWRDTNLGPLVEHVLNTVTAGDVDAAIIAFDTFVEENGLGMSLGGQKGALIEKMVGESLEGKKRVAILEAGAHAGDGSMRIARALLAKKANHKHGDPPHILVSTESNPEWASAAQVLLNHALGRHSKFIHHIVLEVDPDALVTTADEERKQLHVTGFDIVLLDHDHSMFVSDLRSLVQKGILLPNGVVHADNCGSRAFELTDYLQYIEESPFKTKFEDVQSPYEDRVAISTFIGT